MAKQKKRIGDTELLAKFVNGQILNDYDLNEIVNVFKAGVNANKAELNAIITGNSEMLVFTDAVFKDIADDGDDRELAININTTDGEVQFIRKEDGSWKTEESIEPMSLMDIYDRIGDHKDRLDDVENLASANSGRLDDVDIKDAQQDVKINDLEVALGNVVSIWRYE